MTTLSKWRFWGMFGLVLILGLVALIGPILTAQIFLDSQGLVLLLVGVLQLGLIILLLKKTLSIFEISFSELWHSASYQTWIYDIILAIGLALPRILLEFGVFVPLAGGFDNAGVQEASTLLQGSTLIIVGAILYSFLGAVAEEWFFRGFMLTSIPQGIRNGQIGVLIAAGLSIVLFALVHFPTNLMDWLSYIVGGAIYTILFIKTGRLSSAIWAHVIWNALALAAVAFFYM